MANKLMIGLTACIVVFQMWTWFGPLPDPIPSHFNAAGQVDGKTSKVSFYLLFGGMQVLFLFGFPLLAALMTRLPDSMINVPHKEYWLAPARRDRTLAINGIVLSSIGWITGWFFIALFQLTAEVAVNRRGAINPEFHWAMAIYGVVIAISVGWLCYQFRKPAIAT